MEPKNQANEEQETRKREDEAIKRIDSIAKSSSFKNLLNEVNKYCVENKEHHQNSEDSDIEKTIKIVWNNKWALTKTFFSHPLDCMKLGWWYLRHGGPKDVNKFTQRVANETQLFNTINEAGDHKLLENINNVFIKTGDSQEVLEKQKDREDEAIKIIDSIAKSSSFKNLLNKANDYFKSNKDSNETNDEKITKFLLNNKWALTRFFLSHPLDCMKLGWWYLRHGGPKDVNKFTQRVANETQLFNTINEAGDHKLLENIKSALDPTNAVNIEEFLNIIKTPKESTQNIEKLKQQQRQPQQNKIEQTQNMQVGQVKKQSKKNNEIPKNFSTINKKTTEHKQNMQVKDNTTYVQDNFVDIKEKTITVKELMELKKKKEFENKILGKNFVTINISFEQGQIYEQDTNNTQPFKIILEYDHIVKDDKEDAPYSLNLHIS